MNVRPRRHVVVPNLLYFSKLSMSNECLCCNTRLLIFLLLLFFRWHVTKQQQQVSNIVAYRQSCVKKLKFIKQLCLPGKGAQMSHPRALSALRESQARLPGLSSWLDVCSWSDRLERTWRPNMGGSDKVADATDRCDKLQLKQQPKSRYDLIDSSKLRGWIQKHFKHLIE